SHRRDGSARSGTRCAAGNGEEPRTGPAGAPTYGCSVASGAADRWAVGGCGAGAGTVARPVDDVGEAAAPRATESSGLGDGRTVGAAGRVVAESVVTGRPVAAGRAAADGTSVLVAR